MKLSQLQEEWSRDAHIQETNLGQEASRTPQLHAKYIKYISNVKLSLRKAESDYLNTRRKKYRYYRGEMTRQELEEQGWVQYQGNKPLKNEMDEFLQCDEDLLLLEDKVEYFKTVIYTLEQIMRSINSRTWDIKSAIEYQKMNNGLI